jgi:dUTP pyrophosphatase
MEINCSTIVLLYIKIYMKLKIKCKVDDNNYLPVNNPKGDWFDLKCSKTTNLNPPTSGHSEVFFHGKSIPLGIAMQLPKGMEAIVAPRSSLFAEKGIMLRNGIGIIDNTYCGNNDMWRFGALAFSSTIIHEGERICQFRIQLSQKASIWTKLKWLFISRIEFVPVSNLNTVNRGGFGSTKGYK